MPEKTKNNTLSKSKQTSRKKLDEVIGDSQPPLERLSGWDEDAKLEWYEEWEDFDKTTKPRNKAQLPHDAIYQLRVELLDLRPPIWRVIQVRADTKMQQLHEIIQAAMGWENSHLFKFFGYGKTRMISDALDTEGGWTDYQYDFGDSWEHRVTLQKILPMDSNAAYPQCIGGKRACPPEDCGGFPGYEDLCKIMKKPKHPKHKAMLEWLGLHSASEFDPNAFDVAEANGRLKSLKRKTKKRD